MEFKFVLERLLARASAVLIESDWNLNGLSRNTLQVRISVLIESDWNLNLRYELQNFIISHSINRIRLEFKLITETGAEPIHEAVLIESDWNLNLIPNSLTDIFFNVLIESDWNLNSDKTIRNCLCIQY